MATGRWAEHRPAVWPAEDRCGAYPYHRVHRCIDSISYAGDHAAGRHLLWAECGQQKYAGGRPPEAVKWKFFPIGSQRFRQRASRQKEEIVDLALSTEDDILILDPESEFASLVEALNGEVIRISATSDTHLNALDMDSAYGNERNPLIEKSEFILSLFEQLVGAGNLSAKEKSILDRCTADVYRDYMRAVTKGRCRP